MSTIRIDEKHAKLLDKLISQLTLRGNKITKKNLIDRLIEEAMKAGGLEEKEIKTISPENKTWRGLDEVFELGIQDLSENIDNILYRLDEEE